jgi:hypothetical protein
MTLTELLVSACVTTLAAGAALSAVAPLQRGFVAQPEAASRTQRTRVVAELLSADIRQASLVLPFRVGEVGDDIAGGVFYRSDVLTLLNEPVDALASGIVRPTFSRTYHLTRDSEGVWQLMQYDGHLSDQPAVEDIAAMAFEYFGEADAPRAVLTPQGQVRVTYGAVPPPLGIDVPDDAWPAGENCTFAADGEGYVSRLPALGSPGVVPMPAAMLVDGPWCPDATHAFRFDADLLRVRRVRVRIRLQSAQPFRGLAESWRVADETATLEIAPRNVHGGR